MKQLHVSLIQEAEKLSADSAWLTLVEVSVNAFTTVRLVPNFTAVTFAGLDYKPFACQVEEAQTDLKGSLNEVEVVVSNVTREVSSYLENYDLRGRRVRLTGVNSNNLADPTKIVFQEDYEIGDISVTEEVARFRLNHSRVSEHRFPGRRFLRENCQWLYNFTAGRGPECGYVDGFAGPGTLSSSGTTVNGTSTDFLTRFKPGDSITAASQSRIVDVVTSNVLMLVTVAPSPAWSGAAYTISKPTCDKVLGGNNGCRSHNNQARFGGFPAIPGVGGRFT